MRKRKRKNKPVGEAQSSRPFRIMSFDGGGVHAAAYLPIIHDLEVHLGAGLNKSSDIDMFVGTSTGAIVASALKLGARADVIQAMYETCGGQIFKKLPLWYSPFYRYSADTLRDIIARFFKDTLQISPTITWREVAAPSFGQTELVVTLWDVLLEKRTFLSTNPRREYQATHLWDAPLVEIITACCSAPSYFPNRWFIVAGTEYVYCDGGITGLNSPATFGLSLVNAERLLDRRQLHIISLSAGDIPKDSPLTVLDLRDRSLIDIAPLAIDALLSSTSELMDQFYDVFGSDLRVGRYMRTRHFRPHNSRLDDARSIPELTKLFENGSIEVDLWKANDVPKARSSRTLLPTTAERHDSVWLTFFGLKSRHSVLPQDDHVSHSPLLGTTVVANTAFIHKSACLENSEATSSVGPYEVPAEPTKAVHGPAVILAGEVKPTWRAIATVPAAATFGVAVVASLFLLAIGTLYYFSAAAQLTVAERNLRAAHLAQAAVDEKQADLKLLLAAEASDVIDNPMTRSVLFSSLQRFEKLHEISYPKVVHSELAIGNVLGLSSSGRLLVVGFMNGFDIWSIGDETLSWNAFHEVEGKLWAIALDRDGRRLALCKNVGDSPKIIVCDLSGRELHSFELPDKYSCSALVFSGDGKSLGAVDIGGNVHKWALGQMPTELRASLGAEFFVGTAAFLQGGSKVCVGGREGDLVIWDLVDWRETVRLKAENADFSNEMSAISFEADSSVVVGYVDGTIGYWDLQRKKENRHVGSFKKPIRSIHSSGGMYALGAFPATVQWKGRLHGSMQDLESGWKSDVKQVVLSADGSRLIAVHYGGVLITWDLKKKSQFAHPVFKQDKLVRLDCASRSDRLVAELGNGDIVTYQYGVEGSRKMLSNVGPNKMIAVDANGRFVTLVRDDGLNAYVVGLDGKAAKNVELYELGEKPVVIDDVAMTDGCDLVAIRDDGIIVVVERSKSAAQAISRDVVSNKAGSIGQQLSPGQKLSHNSLSLFHEGQRPARAVLSRNGEWCLAQYSNRFVVWDIQKRTSRRVVELTSQPENTIRSRPGDLAISNDGIIVVYVAEDWTLQMCDFRRKSPHFTLLGDSDPFEGQRVRELEFSHDSKLLAVSLKNGTIVLWDVDRRQTVTTPMSNGFISDLKQLRLGNSGTLVTAIVEGSDGLIWDLDPGRLRTIARRIANRSLSDEERSQFGSELRESASAALAEDAAPAKNDR